MDKDAGSGSPGPEGDPEEAQQGETVGILLARLRRSTNLTGAQLAEQVGMSQPKISRLERGVGLPNPDDVELIARALGADEGQIARFRDLARQEQNRITDWLPNPTPLVSSQRNIRRREAAARTFRFFQPAIIAGPLQTSEYARAVLSSFQALFSPGLDVSASSAVPEAVSARVQRQEILADRSRTFHFVMAETVLRNRIGSPEEMPAQIRRLREIARQDNVSISIIPADTWWRIPPIHGFLLLDDDTVTVDLFNNGFTSRHAADAMYYRQVFDSFEQQATTAIDEILDRYLELYLDLSRPATASKRRGRK
jgi:transcriptional regulator with XRE-family HTH domain